MDRDVWNAVRSKQDVERVNENSEVGREASEKYYYLTTKNKINATEGGLKLPQNCIVVKD